MPATSATTSATVNAAKSEPASATDRPLDWRLDGSPGVVSAVAGPTPPGPLSRPARVPSVSQSRRPKTKSTLPAAAATYCVSPT